MRRAWSEGRKMLMLPEGSRKAAERSARSVDGVLVVRHLSCLRMLAGRS